MSTNKKPRDYLKSERAGKKTCSECRKYNFFKTRCLARNKNKSPYLAACPEFYEN